MSDAAFSLGLILPGGCLALLGWVVPRLLSLVFPEGVRPLLLLAATAAGIMLLLGTATFVALYLAQGASLAALVEPGLGGFLLHFARLGALSALFWGPILVLSVASLPRTWVRATW